eukprot:scaffold72860_cov26-Tisochrysis_lutea.AAC.1
MQERSTREVSIQRTQSDEEWSASISSSSTALSLSSKRPSSSSSLKAASSKPSPSRVLRPRREPSHSLAASPSVPRISRRLRVRAPPPRPRPTAPEPRWPDICALPERRRGSIGASVSLISSGTTGAVRSAMSAGSSPTVRLRRSNVPCSALPRPADLLRPSASGWPENSIGRRRRLSCMPMADIPTAPAPRPRGVIGVFDSSASEKRPAGERARDERSPPDASAPRPPVRLSGRPRRAPSALGERGRPRPVPREGRSLFASGTSGPRIAFLSKPLPRPRPELSRRAPPRGAPTTRAARRIALRREGGHTP